MDLSIVIVSYNVKDFLRGAIASVKSSLEAGGIDGEIIVVDNHSADGSVAMVLEEFPNVTLHALEDNLGFGRANNIALREARGKYILLLNPDTILGEDTLGTMLRFMREHPEAGLAGCKLLNGDGTFQLSCRRGFPTPWASFTKLFGLARLFPNSPLFARYNLTYLPVDETYEVDALGGAFMMLSKKALEATHGFDEDFFMYGEDLDLCYRVKQVGFKVFYVPTTATVHFKGESTRRSAVNEVQLFYEAMHVFVKKHYRASFIFSILLRFGIFLRSFVAILQKYRESLLLAATDFLLITASVLLGSEIRLQTWLGLPHWDYPFALFVPPVLVVVLLAILKAYAPSEKPSLRPVLIAFPAILIGLSSLTYFFKEFPASRSFVVIVTVVAAVLLVLGRIAIRIAIRLFRGLGTSASPTFRRAIIVGTDTEAVRIAGLITRTDFLRRFELVGMIDHSLDRVGTQLARRFPIVGDTNMIGKVIREKGVSEVIFTSTALPSTEVLGIMQRASAENPSLRINFSMVPTASDVLLGKQSIELLTELPQGSLPLIPVEYNLDRISHRLAKRMLDIAVSILVFPVAAILAVIQPTTWHLERKKIWTDILLGRRTLVGIENLEDRNAYYQKPGLTSLAAVSAKSGRETDTQQFDYYYARNHSIGMDCEILLKAYFSRTNISERSA